MKLEGISTFVSVAECGSLTEDGAAFLVRAVRIMRDLADAESELAERHGPLSGPLRISAPVTFGRMHLGRRYTLSSRATQAFS